ncbi:energy transducer TonB [Arenicella xantha]|uniref:TonB-like protein n=1 Tax=Arenicella xantha TaxID=644221 RepID=A0A395JNK9_9GAMM|nr:energy transducer TonB [Arenicella xantha]RBP51144.1 TonB-like protein [Arenicella xantha]
MKYHGRRLYCALFTLLALTTAQADSITPPQFVPGSDKTFSAYPGSEVRMARTARVNVAFMVNKDGTVSEPLIEQINNARFRKTVLKWLTHRRYEPASINGEPIDSVIRERFRFNIGYDQRSPRVSTTLFNKLYKEFGEKIIQEEPDQKRLKTLLKKLAGVKHGSALGYEFLSAARYKYAKRFLDRDAQIYAVREVILSSDRMPVALNGRNAEEILLQLLIDAGYQGEAMEAYYIALRKLNRNPRSQFMAQFGPTIDQIRQAMVSDEPYTRPIFIGESGYTFLPVSKRKLTFDNVTGKIDSLKVRCEKKFSEFKFSVESEFEIPESWGACHVQILGKEGSSAQLIQL